jgi:hypothetical protein
VQDLRQAYWKQGQTAGCLFKRMWTPRQDARKSVGKLLRLRQGGFEVQKEPGNKRQIRVLD